MKKYLKDILLNLPTIIGTLLTGHHKIAYGCLTDEDSALCHGTIGMTLLSIGVPLTSGWAISKVSQLIKKRQI